MQQTEKTSFEKLSSINVNDKTEKKNGLTYLSWAFAWSEVKKAHSGATYEIKKFENGLPYVYDQKTGYMVFTSVTIDELTHEMWLPVMDNRNKAMIDNATMFDINKTIMRCLTKNLAMFGLGLYIYAGEDLPENPDNVVPIKQDENPDIISKIETLNTVEEINKFIAKNQDKVTNKQELMKAGRLRKQAIGG